jgi:hypothetical protein
MTLFFKFGEHFGSQNLIWHRLFLVPDGNGAPKNTKGPLKTSKCAKMGQVWVYQGIVSEIKLKWLELSKYYTVNS